ncbi:hypothetical protein DFP72DRAFT_1059571 [Ephemerocybe angulata]|uniref:Uncharacterized protein n=1 Tax=Ephemerocybe angulata TaxID=980116 RepID=A0A8H6IGL3_9AGAR|nr:hypothetical protein DFP72DRAFT_1059571 [Tulosesus angulatus]
MGRPRLYHTPEQIAEANRVKSTKYYNSHRKRILKKRAKAKADSKPKAPGKSKPSRTAEEEHALNVKYWSKRVNAAIIQLKALLGNKPVNDFLTGVCRDFCLASPMDLTKAKDGINQHCVGFDKLSGKLKKYQDQLLNLVGAWDDEFKRANAVASNIREVVAALNELMCAAMVDHQELIRDFNCHTLSFQVKAVVLSAF